jgi:hypothetical protein
LWGKHSVVFHQKNQSAKNLLPLALFQGRS